MVTRFERLGLVVAIGQIPHPAAHGVRRWRISKSDAGKSSNLSDYRKGKSGAGDSRLQQTRFRMPRETRFDNRTAPWKALRYQ